MKNTKRIIGFVLLVALLFSAVSCGVSTTVVDDVVEPPKYVIHLADLGENVEIHTDEQLSYINDAYDSIKKHVPDTHTERSYPKSIRLTWSVNEDEVIPHVRYKVLVSTSPDMSGAKEYTAKEEYYDLINLYIGTTYYWKVSFEKDDEIYESNVASFTTTSKGPRNIKIDGVTNSRDVGGWATSGGKRVKQGMLYRTAKLGWTNSDLITAAGKKTMTDDLGIKTEIELRDGETEIRAKSTLSGVKLFNLGVPNSSKDNMESILPDIFDILADESNYPLFFHCAAGADRTGVVAYLVLALLGVSEKDILRDYSFTNFGKITKESEDSQYRTPNSFQKDGSVAAAVKSSNGKTLQEKCRNYLKSIGISDITLDKIVSIMLEK